MDYITLHYITLHYITYFFYNKWHHITSHYITLHYMHHERRPVPFQFDCKHLASSRGSTRRWRQQLAIDCPLSMAAS